MSITLAGSEYVRFWQENSWLHLDELIFETMHSSKKVLVLDTAVLVESYENVEK